MKKVYLPSTNLEENLDLMREGLGGSCIKICDEICLTISEEAGEGQIRGINVPNGLALFSIHCTLNEDLEIVYKDKQQDMVRFVFCQQGSCKHTLDIGKTEYELDALKGSISANPANQLEIFTFPASKLLTINILEIDRKEYLKKIDCDLSFVPGDLADLFRGTNTIDHIFLYTSNYSLSIAAVIQEINHNDLEGLARKIFFESKALELFSLQIKQYEDDLQDTGKRVVFRQADAQLIKTAQEILVVNLKDPPTITELARKVGLNEQKLKKGFKLLNDITINKFILKKRMEKAKELLLAGSKNIKETAFAVGFSNNGYFAGKFKETFGVLPSDYIRTVKDEVELEVPV